MKTSSKVLVIVSGLIAPPLLVLGYLFSVYPVTSKLEAVEVDRSEASVERGRYLAVHVAVCIDCHSERDFTRFAGPVVPGTEGEGGERFGPEMGFPGELFATNLTPSELASWTDAEIIRATAEGVSKDGHALFPVMPYKDYGLMCRTDLESIVSYLRTLKPIEHVVKRSHLDFPMNILVRTMPEPRREVPCPDGRDQIALGAYLTRTAACAACHTPKVRGKPVPNMELAGGFAFSLPSGAVIRSTNLTSHPTGLGSWSSAQFVQRFKSFESPKATPKVEPTAFNTVMPWTQYAGMTESDLEAMFAYMMTLPPIDNPIELYTMPQGSVARR